MRPRIFISGECWLVGPRRMLVKFLSLTPSLKNSISSGSHGFRQRCILTELNKTATLIGPIYTSLTNQSRLMLPLTPQDFTFQLSRNAFVLRSSHATQRFRVKIEDMKLILCRVKVNPSVSLEVEKRLNQKAALYPIRKASTRALTISAGQKFYEADNLFPSQVVPKDLLIAFNHTTAVQGVQNRSPFNFQPFGIESLKVTVDGHVYPSPFGFERLVWDGREMNFSLAYLSLFDYDVNVNEGLLLNLTEFVNSYCIFRLTLGHFPNALYDHREITKVANARLTVTFGAETDNPALTALIWTETDSTIAITSSRELLKDFTS